MNSKDSIRFGLAITIGASALLSCGGPDDARRRAEAAGLAAQNNYPTSPVELNIAEALGTAVAQKTQRANDYYVEVVPTLTPSFQP